MFLLLTTLGYKYYQLVSANTAYKHISSPLSENKNIHKTIEKNKVIHHAGVEKKQLEDNVELSHGSSHKYLDKEKEHHHISDNLKQALCEKDLINESCVIKNNLDIQKIIIDKISHNIKSDEIGVILASNNFKEVMKDLSANKVNNSSFEREYKFNDRIDKFITNNQHISVDRLACGDIVCATSIYYQDKNDWNSFAKALLKDDEIDKIGNTFIAHFDRKQGQEARILFLPNNNSAVENRIKE